MNDIHKMPAVTLFKCNNRQYILLPGKWFNEVSCTRGMWKKIIIMKMNKELSLVSGSSYNFGIINAHEPETYGDDIKVFNEWPFAEDPDIRQ